MNIAQAFPFTFVFICIYNIQFSPDAWFNNKGSLRVHPINGAKTEK